MDILVDSTYKGEVCSYLKERKKFQKFYLQT